MSWQSGLGILSDLIGVLGALFALGAWIQTRLLQKQIRMEEERINQKITLVLENEQQSIELPFEVRRADLTRAEVLGLIGMISMKEPGRRFSLSYLSKPEFLHKLNQILQSSGDAVLNVPCSKDEIEQFDFSVKS
ncbi:MAG: hypothetical protein KJZ86_07940 [Caldilineaceae bacterium]|nr:hypothetical protein [Caldilineaceae bacterium]